MDAQNNGIKKRPPSWDLAAVTLRLPRTKRQALRRRAAREGMSVQAFLLRFVDAVTKPPRKATVSSATTGGPDDIMQ